MSVENKEIIEKELLSENKCTIPFQSMTITEDTYKDITSKLNELNRLKGNINSLIDLLSDNGVEIRSDKDIFVDDISVAKTSIFEDEDGVYVEIDLE